MASNNGEPGSKRARSEVIRNIKLDMANYDSSVQKLSDNELVKIFELGLKVRESAMLTLDVNQKIVEDALASKMKPVHDSVAKIEKQVTEKVEEVKKNVTQVVGKQMEDVKKNVGSLKKDVSEHMTEIKDELTSRVDKVAQKVQPLDILNTSMNQSAESIKTVVKTEIQSSEKRVSKELEACKQKLESISASLEKPTSKGARAERKVLDVLREGLPSFTFTDTSSERGNGDIVGESPNNHRIMIEVKNREASLSRDAIESFEAMLAKSPQYKVGILLSMTSGIARRAREGRFEIAFNQQKQCQIYVPNAYARNEEHLIVWSVVMADQIANTEPETWQKARPRD
ncbi:hypothetical protein OS493_009412 [Desmophyllum pertusum]|uniref:Uncharacterized protein n=1 Tax=Desmophyllum pertusum TaxID=174260 RepID=A0A9X0CSP6_9CNID|nr:hypothetical protein OS493_009412 [Desmophyllum pertusum]